MRRTPGRTLEALEKDRAPGEKVEDELNRLIEKRAKQLSTEVREEERLKAQAKFRKAEERRRNREAWAAYFAQLGEALAIRSAEYHRRARALLDEGSTTSE